MNDLKKTKADLHKEYQYFLENQDEFAVKYQGMYLVISDQKLVKAYLTKREAYYEPQFKLDMPLGSYLIQKAESKAEHKPITFYSGHTII